MKAVFDTRAGSGYDNDVSQHYASRQKIRWVYFVRKKTINAICRELRDLLLVDGDPLADIRLIEDPVQSFVVVTKDGTIHKQTI